MTTRLQSQREDQVCQHSVHNGDHESCNKVIANRFRCIFNSSTSLQRVQRSPLTRNFKLRHSAIFIWRENRNCLNAGSGKFDASNGYNSMLRKNKCLTKSHFCFPISSLAGSEYILEYWSKNIGLLNHVCGWNKQQSYAVMRMHSSLLHMLSK